MTDTIPPVPAPTVSPDPNTSDAALVKAALKYETSSPSTSMIPRVSASGLADDIAALARTAVADALATAPAHVPPSFWRKLTRQSDRLLTPLSLSFLAVSTVCLILGTVGFMLWTQQHGQDPQTVLDDVMKIITALGTVFTSTLLVMHRQQTSRIERNTGK